MITHFLCCDTVMGMAGYTRHMAEAHEGRKDCVRGLTSKQAARIIDGEPIADVLQPAVSAR